MYARGEQVPMGINKSLVSAYWLAMGIDCTERFGAIAVVVKPRGLRIFD